MVYYWPSLLEGKKEASNSQVIVIADDNLDETTETSTQTWINNNNHYLI